MTGMHHATRLDVRGRRLPLTPALLDHVARRLGLALGRFADVRHVSVRVADVHGPRGGVDKRCHLRVSVAGRAITIEEIDHDLHAAIDRAAERAGRVIAGVRTARSLDAGAP